MPNHASTAVVAPCHASGRKYTAHRLPALCQAHARVKNYNNLCQCRQSTAYTRCIESVRRVFALVIQVASRQQRPLAVVEEELVSAEARAPCVVAIVATAMSLCLAVFDLLPRFVCPARPATRWRRLPGRRQTFGRDTTTRSKIHCLVRSASISRRVSGLIKHSNACVNSWKYMGR